MKKVDRCKRNVRPVITTNHLTGRRICVVGEVFKIVLPNFVVEVLS